MLLILLPPALRGTKCRFLLRFQIRVLFGKLFCAFRSLDASRKEGVELDQASSCATHALCDVYLRNQWLMAIQVTCKSWSAGDSADNLWRALYLRLFESQSASDKSVAGAESTSWKKRVAVRTRSERNWLAGKVRLTTLPC